MKSIRRAVLFAAVVSPVLGLALVPLASAQAKKPNIVVIMGDDVGWENIGAYHHGLMYSVTPNLDRLSAQGMRFTDYYAEPSCTAGRANFITGELPIRTGLTTVGQAGAAIGIPDQAPTIATALKAMGYRTGQFGKNHLGDLNRYLPTVHGFDEFFGYLYHLDAMEDPFWHSYPPALKDVVGPRNLIHSWASNTDDPTVEPRWGKVGRQKIEDDHYDFAPVLAIEQLIAALDQRQNIDDSNAELALRHQEIRQRLLVLRVDLHQDDVLRSQFRECKQASGSSME